MLTYKPIDAIIPRIPKAVREDENYATLMSNALQAYRDIAGPSDDKERIAIFDIVNHTVQLPESMHTINLVTYLCPGNGCTSVCKDQTVESTTVECTDCATGNYQIFHQVFLDSSYYHKCYEPLKYVGDSPMCTHCWNRHCHDCAETFSVDETGKLTTSIKEGKLCIVYLEYLQDKDGKYLVIDDPAVLRYLAIHATFRYLEERLLSSEQGAIAAFDRYLSLESIWQNKARGSIRQLTANLGAIRELGIDRYNAIMMRALPYYIRDKYEFNYGR